MSGTVQTSLHGRVLGIAPEGHIVGRGKDITQPCVDAVITVGAEVANVRAISIQLNDARDEAITYAETVEILVFTDASATAFATSGGSTGVEIGTDGALLALVAKKAFLATSEATGHIDLNWTDTGTEGVAIGVRLPNGRVVMSAAFANT